MKTATDTKTKKLAYYTLIKNIKLSCNPASTYRVV